MLRCLPDRHAEKRMQTNTMLDDALVKQTQTPTGIKTKRAVEDKTQRLLICLYEQAEVLRLRKQLP